MEISTGFKIQQRKSHLLLNMILNSNHYVFYTERERGKVQVELLLYFLKTSDQF